MDSIHGFCNFCIFNEARYTYLRSTYASINIDSCLGKCAKHPGCNSWIPEHTSAYNAGYLRNVFFNEDSNGIQFICNLINNLLRLYKSPLATVKTISVTFFQYYVCFWTIISTSIFASANAGKNRMRNAWIVRYAENSNFCYLKSYARRP